MKDPAAGYFNCSDSERAAFEAGIKLGALYHQFVGMPMDPENVEDVEKAIEDSIRAQPFVADVKVHIRRDMIKRGRNIYKYCTLHGEMLDVRLVVRYGRSETVCRLRYVEDLKYPLMYVEAIREV